MTCTLYLVVSTSLLSDSLSGLAVPRSMCSLVSLMFLLPCLLLTDLRPVSTLSLLCSLAHILIRWRGVIIVPCLLWGLHTWTHTVSWPTNCIQSRQQGCLHNLVSLSFLSLLISCWLCRLLPHATRCCCRLFHLFLMAGLLHETPKKWSQHLSLAPTPNKMA